MTVAPRCAGLDRHCRELAVTLSIGSLDEDDAGTRDALATWLLGHRQRIAFREPRRQGGRVVVDAVISIPCRYLETDGEGSWGMGRDGNGRKAMAVRCRAHGFVGNLPHQVPTAPPPLQHGDGSLTLVHRGRSRRLTLRRRPAPPRQLPVLSGTNPCAGASCRTADHTRGAACCRDLTLEIVAPADDAASPQLEALLLARRSPYLCKTERVGPEIIEAEVISACGYLEGDGISCALHHRIRPDGNPAKPFVCSAWPDLGPEDVGHPGCVLLKPQDGAPAEPRQRVVAKPRGGLSAAWPSGTAAR